MERNWSPTAWGFLFAVGVVAVSVGVVAGGGFEGSATLGQMEGSGTPDDPYVITSVEELQAMNDDLDAHYVLGNGIDASSTASWNGGEGFEPIGGDAGVPPDRFTGTFDGNGHTITGLTIDRESSHEAFVARLTGVVENVEFEAAKIDGVRRVGVVVAHSDGTVRNVSASGEVSGVEAVGGVVGTSEGTVTNATSQVTVSGTEPVGGLVGVADGEITASSATGDVSGEQRVGGLVGTLTGQITVSYASGDVFGETDVGGLVGYTRAKDGDERLVNTYATGRVTGTRNVGGLVGRLQIPAGSSFAAGRVTGTRNVGGVVGRLAGPVPSGLSWDVDATGQRGGIGGGNAPVDGVFTDELTGTAATARGFYTGSVWTATDSYPILDWQLRDVELTITGSPAVAGATTRAAVTLTLADGTTVTASETASYDLDTGVATVDEGIIETRSAGETDVTASLGGQSDSATLNVQAPPDISLVDATLAADGAVTGFETAIDATFENAGGTPGTETVAVTVDGEMARNATVTVAGGAAETVTLRWDVVAEPGEYDVSVAGTDVGTLTVVYGTAITFAGVDAPDAVAPGEVYDVGASFDNSVDVPVAVPVSYGVGDGEQERIVTVESGRSTVTFTETAPDSAGETVEHTVGYEGSADSAVTEISEPAAFRVASLDGPETVETGETIEVTATVANTGDLDGTTDVQITVDGQDVFTETVTLAGGETTEVTATVTVDAGDSVAYTASVGENERSDSANVESGTDGSPDSAGDDGTEETDADDGDGAGFGVAVALGALLWVTFLGARRL